MTSSDIAKYTVQVQNTYIATIATNIQVSANQVLPRALAPLLLTHPHIHAPMRGPRP